MEFSCLGELACVTSCEYGSSGPGRLCVLERDDAYNWRTFDWSLGGLLDLCWPKNCSDLVFTSSMDGSIQLWHTKAGESEGGMVKTKPVLVYNEHEAEVHTINWTTLNQNPQVLSGSHDHTIRLWDPSYTHSILTFHDKENLIYSVHFSGSHRNLFCSTGTDGNLKIWSLSEANPISIFKMGKEALCCDWSEVNENLIAVGNESGTTIVMDLRFTSQPLKHLSSGNLSIRGVKFSPHSEMCATVGYDSVTR